ncbi:MurR/RpiR family transcriptional regulator [Erysipelothrix urinaevulpis]|uniref:MurR/RpiR family transcriptional regulator n=1 Tax=Erysipelothrix urinaevulpis TaxID=2683717 RepID=UPI00135C4316|nr:MurR/RpiR family transcriptional regulator [Erysipelothrix urinaevulpis]
MNQRKIDALIEQKSKNLTSTEIEIANYVKTNPELLTQIPTITKLSEVSGFSVGSIVRFCKKLGFEGYSEFKFFIANNLIEIDLNHDDDYLDVLLDIYIREISLLKQQLDLKAVSNLSKKIVESDTVVIIGKNNSYTAANQLKLRLIRQGIKAISLDDDKTIYNYADILDLNDIVLIFSVSGFGFNDYPGMIQAYQKNNVPLQLITMDKNSRIYDIANQTILLPNSMIAKKHMALDGQILFLIFIDILLHKIANYQIK